MLGGYTYSQGNFNYTYTVDVSEEDIMLAFAEGRCIALRYLEKDLSSEDGEPFIPSDKAYGYVVTDARTGEDLGSGNYSNVVTAVGNFFDIYTHTTKAWLATLAFSTDSTVHFFITEPQS